MLTKDLFSLKFAKYKNRWSSVTSNLPVLNIAYNILLWYRQFFIYRSKIWNDWWLPVSTSHFCHHCFCSQVVLLALTAHSFDISVLCIQFECFLCFVLFPPFAIFVSKTHSTVVSPWLLKQITFCGIAVVFKFISTEGYSKLVVTTRTHYRKLKENPLHSLYY